MRRFRGDLVSLDLNGFNLDVECHFHFEPIPLTDGDAEVHAVKPGDRVCATHVFLRRREIDRTFEGIDS
jgi:hypothetical protein